MKPSLMLDAGHPELGGLGLTVRRSSEASQSRHRDPSSRPPQKAGAV